MKPSIGRIVHYVIAAECRAAVITEVFEDSDEQVGLCVLNPHGIFFHVAYQNEEAPWKGGTWHWPERVE